jgi:phospholipase/lecithinase/hemolysin
MFVKPWVNRLRWAILASPLLWLVLLNGCGTGTVLDPFTPTRIIAFGDAFMDVRTPRFTVNDEIPIQNTSPTTYTTLLTGTSSSIHYQYAFNSYFYLYGYITSAINQYAPGVFDSTTSTTDLALNPELTVIERIAADYGFSTAVVPMSNITTHIVPSTSGVYSFAQGNALVMSPDQTSANVDSPQSYSAGAYGGSVSPALSVQAQIDLFLNNNSISTTDMFVVNAGTADVLYNIVGAGSAGGVATAAQNLVNQVLRLKNAGAKHIVVFGPPNMGRSPFAYKNSLTSSLANYSKTLNTGSCIDFNCALEYGLQAAIGTITQNPVVYVDLSSQTSLITGTTNTGSTNTFASFTDPLYGVAISFPGDNTSTAFEDYSATNGASDGNYYCNQTNIGSTTAFFITAPAVSTSPITGTYSGLASTARAYSPTGSATYSGTYGGFTITGSYCFANPVKPTGTYSTSYTGPYSYLQYAYADPVYFTPSVHRMLGDLILGKLSLASWR